MFEVCGEGGSGVTKARVKCNTILPPGLAFFLYEFDFWEELPLAPAVTTNAVSSVEETTSTLNGEVTAINDTSITERGFVWDTSTHGAPGNVAPASSGYASNWTEEGSFGVASFNHGLTSLTEGELYYVRACAENDNGDWGYGDEVTFLTKPDPPSTFTATAAGETQIDLSWTNGDGSQKVYIIGKEDSAPSSRIDYDWTWNGTGTTKSHTGLSEGEHWYYQIWSYATEGALEQTSDTPDLTDDATTVGPPIVASLQVEGTGSYMFGRWVILRGQSPTTMGWMSTRLALSMACPIVTGSQSTRAVAGGRGTSSCFGSAF
jgi:hypothetical protein